MTKMAVDMFGEVPAVAAAKTDASKRRKRAADAPPPETVQAEAAFKAAFDKKFPNTPSIYDASIGANRKLLKQLVAAYGLPVVVDELIPAFFASTDDRVRRLQYRVQDMFAVAQWLIINRRNGTKALHPRTAENLDEARKATGRK